jgi:hypothetical protein
MKKTEIEIKANGKKTLAPDNNEILSILLQKLKSIKFTTYDALKVSPAVNNKNKSVWCAEMVCDIAEKNGWGIKYNRNAVCLYNGCTWSKVENSKFQQFLIDISEYVGLSLSTGNVLISTAASSKSTLYLSPSARLKFTG